ncbi:CACTA en-spm transposon protein [Cucumis melo var. makuwa]|uniref:CACTA en-spm transposon protein n=1 Tax=Cucumis melo var. makuwa TaxID=1194695 RepID=A0A5A7TQP9_CUCMM|nr:CACTA en-spm transposon protein [Cucumis melo var. makuwa]
MDKSLMNVRNKLSIEYKEELFKFLDFAKYHVDEYGRIRCPCERCMNSNWDSLEGVERHLLTIEMCPSYTEWVYHGEPINLYRSIERFDERTSSDPFHEGTSNDLFHINGTSSNLFSKDNEMLGILHDLQGLENETAEEEDLENDMSFNSDVKKETTNIYEELLNQARLRYKASHIRGKNLTQGIATLSIDTEIIEIICIQEDSLKIRWHQEQVETDDVLRHPTDAEGWKHFDYEFPEFALDPWNVHLGVQLHHVIANTQSKISRTKWYQPCPICMGDKWSFGIRDKIAFMGHWRYLPNKHVSHRSTQWNIEGKTKDTTHARLEDLHLIEVGNRLVKPHASYTLTSSKRVAFFHFLKSVKFSDGIETRFSWDEENDDSIPKDDIVVEFEEFMQKVIKTHERDDLSHDFFSLVMGPSLDVQSYIGCIMGGTMSQFSSGFDENNGLFDFNVKEFNIILGTSSQWFVLDFTDLALTRFVEHQILSMYKEFRGQNHRHFKKFDDPEQVRANPPPKLSNRDKDWHFLYDH